MRSILERVARSNLGSVFHHSFMHSLTHSYVHSFIHLFSLSPWNRWDGRGFLADNPDVRESPWPLSRRCMIVKRRTSQLLSISRSLVPSLPLSPSSNRSACRHTAHAQKRAHTYMYTLGSARSNVTDGSIRINWVTVRGFAAGQWPQGYIRGFRCVCSPVRSCKRGGESAVALSSRSVTPIKPRRHSQRVPTNQLLLFSLFFFYSFFLENWKHTATRSPRDTALSVCPSG